MVHPIFSVLVTRPELVMDHVAGYAALVQEEASTVGVQVAKRAVAWGVAVLALFVFLLLAGVAVMLGVMHGEFHWVLVLVPATALWYRWEHGRGAQAVAHEGVHRAEGPDRRGRPGTAHRGGTVMSDAADKLARSRLALIEHIQRRERRDEKKEARRARAREQDEQGEQDEQDWDQSEARDGAARWFARIKRAALAWWRSHPARLGVELATPVLSGYAKRKPAQFLGIAAAVGAIVIVARPWRLVSMTGLVVALLKSSQLSSVVMSAMSTADFKKENPQ